MTENSCEIKDSDSGLDSLLDDALEDFNKPVTQRLPSNSNATNAPANKDQPPTSDVWTEEFIQQATKQFESNIRQMMQQQQENQQSSPHTNEENSSLGADALPNDFTKLAEAAAKAATKPTHDKDFASCLSDTMQQLNQNTVEAQAPPSADDLEKMFENFSLGGGLGFGDESNSTAGGFFPIMQTMMENILSKDVLYAPVKEIITKYPDWLADNRSTLSEDDFQRYNKQYDVMKRVATLFEKETDDDHPEEKAKNFEEILQLMQQLQELGQPPKDLVGDFGPAINFDGSGNPIMPDLSSLLQVAGFPNAGNEAKSQDSNASQNKSDQEQCSIM